MNSASGSLNSGLSCPFGRFEQEIIKKKLPFNKNPGSSLYSYTALFKFGIMKDYQIQHPGGAMSPLMMTINRFKPTGNTHLFLMTGLAGTWRAMSYSLNYGPSTSFSSSVITNVFIGICTGWLFFYLYAAVLNLLSKTVGGQGNTRSTYSAMADSFLPALLFIFIYLAVFYLYGDSVMRKPESNNFFTIHSALSVLSSLTFAWMLFNFTRRMTRVWKLSLLKTLFVLALPVLIPVALFLLVAS